MFKELIGLIFVVGLVALFLAIFIFFLSRFRKSAVVSDEFFRTTVSSVVSQLVGGCLIAVVSFWAAHYQFELREREKARASEIDSLIRVQNEIKENFFGAGIALKSKPTKIGGALLKTEAWDKEKYNIDLKTKDLWGALKILYSNIDNYNFLVSSIKYKVVQQNLSPNKIPDSVAERQRNILRDLYRRLNKFRKLLAREMVLIGFYSKKSYEDQYGSWELKIEIPYTRGSDAEQAPK